MTDSLLLGTYELIDQSASSPYLAGFSGNTEDLGEPVPDVATVLGQLLDGDRVSGSRSGNRTITLPILVSSMAATPSKKDLTTQVNALLAVVNDIENDGFTLTWTPDGGLPVVFDCRRGAWTRTRDPILEAQFKTIVTLTFPALPFGRSPAAQTVTVPATGGLAQIQVDSMNSGSFTNATLDTTTKFEGAGAAAVAMTLSGGSYSSANVSRTVTSTDLSQMVSVGVRVRTAPVPPSQASFIIPKLIVVVTLASSGGAISGAVVVDTTKPGPWFVAQMSMSNMTTVGTFNSAAVTSWSVNLSGAWQGQNPVNFTAWLDDLRAYPPASVGNSTAEGGVLAVPGVIGTARTPTALEIARAPLAQSSGNILTAADSSVETIGSWIATSGDTVLSSTAQALQGTHSLALTATGSGGMQASNLAAAKAAVNPNTVYTVTASSKAAATPRLFSVGVIWVDKSGNFARVDVVGPVNDTTSGWTTATANFTSPPNAQFVFLTLVYAASATSEVHYVDAVGVIVGASKPWVIGTGTYTVPTPLTMTNCLIHFPPGEQDPDCTILAGLSAGTVTVPAANVNYNDTFTVVGLLSSSAAGTRTVTVTVTQKVGATTLGSTSFTASITGTQTIVPLGQIVLPLYAVPTDNTNGSIVILISSAGDTWSDVALCSTKGQTILLTGLPAATTGVYVDLPDVTTETGPVYITTTDRTAAYAANAVSGSSMIPSGGAPLLEPGFVNRVLVASTNGAPGAIGTYYPKWLDERDV